MEHRRGNDPVRMYGLHRYHVVRGKQTACVRAGARFLGERKPSRGHQCAHYGQYETVIQPCRSSHPAPPVTHFGVSARANQPSTSTPLSSTFREYGQQDVSKGHPRIVADTEVTLVPATPPGSVVVHEIWGFEKLRRPRLKLPIT
jgi:hypothetical protein